MKDIIELMEDIIEEGFIHGVISNLRDRNTDSYNKVDIKPVMIREEIMYQFTFEYDEKVMHKNLDEDEFKYRVINLLDREFRQAMIFTKSADYQILISKKGKTKIIKHKPTKKEVDLSHNRKKEYILKEGRPVDFLIRLGVMEENGQVIARRYDKFRQINRFLELVEDILPQIEKKEKINILDFGCGKSYLTFALYYYLVKIKELDVNIIGLDLKKDVIDFCNNVADDLEYKELEFIHKDINDYELKEDIDMVVTLHACDTATDAAIIKAINWNADVILSVPCCQHEFFDKIENNKFNPMLKHGIIKDKLSSLVTDSLRGLVLEMKGYQVQLIEFIDMEHTPKNILIRGIKNNNIDREKAFKEYQEFKDFWNLEDIFIEENLDI